MFECIDVKQWIEEDLHQEGHRGKRRLLPTKKEMERGFKDRPYLLKYASRKHPWNLWVEILCFHLGRIIGIRVPPTYIVRYKERYASLQEWFYDPRMECRINIDEKRYYDVKSSSETAFMSGKIRLQKFNEQQSKEFALRIKLHEPHKGHNIEDSIEAMSNQTINIGGEFREWINRERFIKDFFLLLCWDAFIGNTDRHEENWGLLWDSEIEQYRLSPFYDNGSSLTHNISEQDIERYRNNEKGCLDRYLKGGGNNKQKKKNKGQHHICFSKNREKERGFL